MLAKHLRVPVSTLVLIPNATTGFDTIIRNLAPSFTAGDTIVDFALSYETFASTIEYLCETTPLERSRVEYTLPVSDEWICRAFEKRVREIREEGKRVRAAVFETVSSLPGTRMPYARLVEICRREGVLSIVDGAHGVGMLEELDVEKLDADFFVSNCHKWLSVPRPCAVLVVPERNQKVLRVSLPTGVESVREAEAEVGRGEEGKEVVKEEDGGEKSRFVKTFAYTGTLDDNPYLCLEAALEWRKKVTWGSKTGDEAIKGYISDLSKKGGKRVAEIMRSEVLENEEGTLGNSGFANVRLPLTLEDVSTEIENEKQCKEIAAEIMRCMIQKHGIALFVYFYAGNWWTRLSAQVFLTLDDFERAGRTLKKVCGNGEWMSS